MKFRKLIKNSILAIGLVVYSSGCSMFQTSWQKAPYTHRCTVEEMNRVDAETKHCVSVSGYTSDFCYGAAIARICRKQ